MKKQISSKIVSLTFSILVICFAIGFYIFAWTEPSSSPPAGNVDAPINVGGTTQYKSGAFGVGGLFETDDETHLAIDGGNVGIGTTDPSMGSDGTQLKLDVEGPIGAIKYCDENGDNCKTIMEMGGGGAAFGNWVDVTAAASGGAVQSAATDGIVCAWHDGTFLPTRGYTDSSPSPTTLRIQLYGDEGTRPGITMPVKKNDYWKVTGAQHVYWIPLVPAVGAYDQNCAWTAWGTCTCSGTPSISCPAGKVATGFGSRGCSDDVTRCDQQRLYCCGQ